MRGRLGYASDRVLVYATAGLAYGGIRNTLSVTAGGTDGSTGVASTSRDRTAVGAALDGGLELALSPVWSLKGEIPTLFVVM